MLKKLLNLLFVAIGVGFFVKMILVYDLSAIWQDVSVIGWGFLWVLLLWLLFLAADTVTWRHTMGPDKSKVGYVRLGLIMAAGQSVNGVAPSGNIGELIKGKYLAEDLGGSASVSSVLIFNFLHMAGSAVLVSAGAVSALYLPQVPRYLAAALLAASVVVVGWTLLVLLMMRNNVAERIVKIVKRLKIPLKRPEDLVAAAKRIDVSLRGFRLLHPRDFWITVIAQGVSRAAAVAEVYLVCLLLQRPVSVAMAFFIMSVSQLLFWVFAMIPSQIGVMEQSSDALFGAMAYQPGAGFAFELVRRGRKVVQVAFGLAILLLLSMRTSRRGKPGLAVGKVARES